MLQAHVTTDSDPSLFDSAWSSISQSRDHPAALGTFTRTRVERIINLVVGFGFLALGLQAFIAALGPAEEFGAWHTALMALTFIPFAAMVVACFVGRAVRIFSGAFALIFIVALALWPIVTVGSTPEPTGQPWIFYLINVATVASVLAFPLPLQITWTILTPLLYGFVRLLQGQFAPDFFFPVVLDVSFALILGSVLLTLGWLFRGVAANVDETRARAVASYARAAAAAATEQERVSVAALMHDSVLAALIAIERADSPRERALAVTMSREALTGLADAERDPETGSGEPISMSGLADAVRNAAAEFGIIPPLSRTIDPDAPAVPGSVARALVLAATQAIANAIQHADGEELRLEVIGRLESPRVVVRVIDGGTGFEPDAVPADRLGISASIVARVSAVGGRSRIDSDARGTVVTLEWDDTP